jgi:hypothetical protein
MSGSELRYMPEICIVLDRKSVLLIASAQTKHRINISSTETNA